jgi:beta-mannosidase
VYLEAFNSSVVRYLMADHQDAPNTTDSWLVTISAYLSAKKGETIVGKLLYNLQTDVSLIQEVVDVNHTSDNGDDVRVDFSVEIAKIAVRSWWPNGYGEQKLYNLSAEFRNGDETSTKSVRIGFREIELVQEKIGTGLSFYFKVNGMPIFAKGANEIPLDVLPERGQNPETVSRILESAHATNMNMLRVWGGGVYESDYFYDKADELGILIWQDFMFACAMYPTYPEYLNNVAAEVRHQVKRLNSHPSIALWAGNNENEVALMTNWYGTHSNLTLYKDDYIKLYIDTIEPELRKVTDSVIFLSSSPTNGKESVQEHYLASNPQDPLYGDGTTWTLLILFECHE